MGHGEPYGSAGKPILGQIDNERKVRSLEKAFLHLTTLVTDRKDPFPVP